MEIIFNGDNIFKMKEFYILLYITTINGYGLWITGMDKYKAKKDKWRIQEKTFFLTALLGGAGGIMMGMTLFRHKTQHKSFYVGIPMAYMVNIIYFFLLLYFVYIR